MWIGLHKDYAGEIRQVDCAVYKPADNYAPIQNINKDCVFLDADITTFKGEDCTKAMPFLCHGTNITLPLICKDSYFCLILS